MHALSLQPTISLAEQGLRRRAIIGGCAGPAGSIEGLLRLQEGVLILRLHIQRLLAVPLSPLSLPIPVLRLHILQTCIYSSSYLWICFSRLSGNLKSRPATAGCMHDTCSCLGCLAALSRHHLLRPAAARASADEQHVIKTGSGRTSASAARERVSSRLTRSAGSTYWSPLSISCLTWQPSPPLSCHTPRVSDSCCLWLLMSERSASTARRHCLLTAFLAQGARRHASRVAGASAIRGKKTYPIPLIQVSSSLQAQALLRRPEQDIAGAPQQDRQYGQRHRQQRLYWRALN